MVRSAALVDGFVAGDRPVYGVTTGFGSLADTVIPHERTGRAAGRAGPVARRRHGRHRRARGRAGDAPAARPQPGDGPLGRPPGAGRPAAGAAQRRPHAGRARARLARGERRPRATRPLRAGDDRRGRSVGTPTGDIVPTAEALADAGLEPVVLRAKEGLALINGTDGILGMLCLAIHDLDGCSRRLADVTAAMTRRGVARHRPRVRRRSAGAASAGRARRSAPATCAACSPARRSSPATARAIPGCRTPTRLRCTPQVHGAALDTLAHARTIAERELDAAIDNPMILPDGRVESCGNFHGAPLGFVCDFLAIAASELSAISRTPHRPAARRHPLARPAAVPRARSWRQLGADDRPLHAGRDGDGEQAPRGAGERRLAADERDAGGPRVDGVVGRPQAAPQRRQPAPGAGRRARVRGARGSTCGRPSNRPPAPAPRSARLRGRVDGAGPDRWLSPELGAAEDLMRSGAVLDAVESAIGPLDVV